MVSSPLPVVELSEITRELEEEDEDTASVFVTTITCFGNSTDTIKATVATLASRASRNLIGLHFWQV
jgi:hypothetical protein